MDSPQRTKSLWPTTNGLRDQHDKGGKELFVSVGFFRCVRLLAPLNIFSQLLTGRPWQKPADVPCHCGLIFRRGSSNTTEMYDFVIRGVCHISWTPEENREPPGLMKEIAIAVPCANDTLDFCRASVARSMTYDWGTVVFDALLLPCPRVETAALSEYGRYTCARYVAAALRAGGLDLDHGCKPLSPNCLMLRLATAQQSQTSERSFERVTRGLTA